MTAPHQLTIEDADALMQQIADDRRSIARQALIAAAIYAELDGDKARKAIGVAMEMDSRLVRGISK